MRKDFLMAAGIILTLTSCKTSYFTARDKITADKVADWQMRNFSDTVPVLGWVHAALYRGMVEWANATQSEKIYNFLYQIGEQQDWDMIPDRTYDADDLCVGQTYFRLYDKYGREEMVSKVKNRVDYIIAHPDTNPLITKDGKYYRNRWGWCDALFMAPPVYARLSQKTGDNKYLDFCFSEYKVTTDSLYDEDRKLFYRDLRLVNNRDARGNKIFWGRGNGWVYAGLALMLDLVPRSHASYDYYKKLYLEMSDAIVTCQDSHGSWHSSLFDAGTYTQPENSASAFFVFGLSWGLNNKILSRKVYLDAVTKGWKSLQKYIHPDGKLGYVQPIGHAPREITFDMTAPYGVGAYLLAATEMRKLDARKKE